MKRYNLLSNTVIIRTIEILMEKYHILLNTIVLNI